MKAAKTILTLSSAVLSCAGLAGADPPPVESTAQALFEQGREAMRRGAYAEACPKFAESERLDPSSGTLLNLVLCEEKLGKVASAWTHARQLVDRLPPDDPRKSIAERRLAVLAPRVPRVAVRLPADAPLGARVLLDDTELDVSALHEPMPIDPGAHRLTVKAPNRADHSAELSIEEGRTYEWLAQLGPAQQPETPPLAPAPATAPRAPSQPTATGDSRYPVPAADRANAADQPRWLGWAATGVGAASLATGGVLLVMVFDRLATVRENCHDKWCDQAGVDAGQQGQVLQIAAGAALAVGAAGLGFGIYTLTRTNDEARAGARASIVATPSSAFLNYGAAF